MASSHFKSEQFMSEAFVESAGAVLFCLPSREVYILHLLKSDEYILPKGRRNCGESRQAAALREILEETGFVSRLLPLNMSTRAPPAVETKQLDDEVRFYTGICEPFNLQIRRLSNSDVKLIWWFVATIDEDTPIERSLDDRRRYSVKFYSYTEVLEKLTFQNDRDIVKRAIDLVSNTYTS
jgi:8-oxo-dGTP pyrophosphatase MutT (NUDIX family)